MTKNKAVPPVDVRGNLERLGFRFGISGPHAARTMMLEDLRTLMRAAPQSANRADLMHLVVRENVLGKPTQKSRQLAARHLIALYGLDPELPLFRALQKLWPKNAGAQPLLAFAVALARDPLVRDTLHLCLKTPVGSTIQRASLERHLEALGPGRFRPTSLRSTAQNLAGSWTAAGLTEGKSRKVRAVPPKTPEAIAMLLFLGYLEGRTGARLFSSPWLELLCCSIADIDALTVAAAHRGLLIYLHAGGVKEVRFSDYLTREEEIVRQEVASVV